MNEHKNVLSGLVGLMGGVYDFVAVVTSNDPEGGSLLYTWSIFKRPPHKKLQPLF
jgi:hypothetical protein